ncbi:MAG: acyl-CoA thioesterase [Actinomycetota bacterium]
MDARTFLGLEPTDDPRHWRLPVVPGITAGGNFLWGGCGLAAGIVTMEEVTGRPIVWSTAQYLSYARPGSVVDVEVTVAVDGRNTAQARAVGRVGDEEILTVNGALGSRPVDASGVWGAMPEVPPPEQCPIRTHRFPNESIGDRIEQRLAIGVEMEALDGEPTDGRCALWARMPEVLDMSGAALAVLGDFVPWGIGQALGLRAGGNSLDNTLRVIQTRPADWVLLDIAVHGVADGYGHGRLNLWTPQGDLLAVASQSVVVRRWDDPPPSHQPRPTEEEHTDVEEQHDD